MQIFNSSEVPFYKRSAEFSELLTKIFNQNIEVSSEIDKSIGSKKFYFVLDRDKSIKLVLPYHDNSHLLSYMSPTRIHSKLTLIALKLFYKLRILRYLNNFEIASLKGIDSINWRKYGWNKKSPPNIFVVVGTLKTSQNSVVFLDSKNNPKECLVLKVCIKKLCNLENEYFTGKSIELNSTEYVVFNSKEGYLTQKYTPGFRRIAKLNNFHVDFLSRLVIRADKKSGAVVKENLQNLVTKFNGYDEYNVFLVESLISAVDEKFYFYCANVHGDFAPFNIIYSDFPENFSAIDWENSCLNGLALSDLFNYVYIRDCLFANEGAQKLEPFIYRMAQRYFFNIGHSLTMAEFYEYKIAFVVSKFIERLMDSGTRDIYVKYLYEIIKNEY